jgi:hypothetical protein
VPDRGGGRYVVGVVKTEVSAGKNLLVEIRVHDHGVNRDVRKIAGLIAPGEGGAVARAYDLKEMAGRARGIRVETADGGISHRHVRCRHDRIQGNSEHRPVRQHRITTRYIHPVRLCRYAGPKVKADLDVAIVSADNRYALVFR